MNERQICMEVLGPRFQAEVEVPVWDGTRCDLLTDEFAIEVDWATKWAEALGQAMYYAIALDRKPAILLLVKDYKDRRYAHRAQAVCSKYGIRMFQERIR